MLNPFPDLLVYSLIAPLFLRVVAGAIFVNLGILAFRGEKQRWLNSFSVLRIPQPILTLKILSAIEIIGGIMLIVGFYIQIITLILALFIFAESYIEYKDPSILKRNLVFYIMLLTIIISLLFSGAGAFAFDLPL